MPKPTPRDLSDKVGKAMEKVLASPSAFSRSGTTPLYDALQRNAPKIRKAIEDGHSLRQISIAIEQAEAPAGNKTIVKYLKKLFKDSIDKANSAKGHGGEQTGATSTGRGASSRKKNAKSVATAGGARKKRTRKKTARKR
jgi:hypothetical protein